MAASFSAKIGTTGYGYTVYLKGYLEEKSYSVETNTSVVLRQLYAIIEGGTASDYNTKVIGNGSTLLNGYFEVTTTAKYFINDTITVAHDAEGKGSYTLSGSMSMSYLGYSGGSSCTLKLTDIPRTSAVSVSKTSILAGTKQTISLSRATSSFTHNLYYRINGSGSWNTLATKVATSYDWTIPMTLITTVENKSATINISAETYSGNTYIGGQQTSFTLTPYSASTISSYTGSTLGEKMSIVISPSNSAFKHEITYAYGDASGTIATNISNSTEWTIPKALANQTPSAEKGSGYLYVTTYYGNLQIGSRQPKSITLYLPNTADFFPKFTNVTAELVNDKMPSDWNVYARTLAKAKLSVNGAQGAYGSSISVYSIIGAGFSTDKSTFTTGLLNEVGTFTFVAKITDTRGRSYTDTVEITVVDYDLPSVTCGAVRCREDGTVDPRGTYLKVDVSFKYWEVNGLNNAYATVSCNGTSEQVAESGSTIILNANCLVSRLYTLSVTVSDEVYTSDPPLMITILPSTEIWVARGDGKAFAVGGYPTRLNAFQSWWPIYDHLDRMIEIGALGFYISHDDSSVTLGNYEDWVNAGMPLWPED